MRSNNIKLGILSFVITALLGCMSKGSMDRALRPSIDIPEYSYDEPFQCVKESYEVSLEAERQFKMAEKIPASQINVEDKIEAYEKAFELGHPKALEKILSLYQLYNREDIYYVLSKPHNDPNVQIYNTPQEKIIKVMRYDKEIANTKKRMLETQNSYEGLVNLAQMKIVGKEVYQNKKKAFDYLMYASKKGNLSAQAALGTFYFYQLGEYEKGVEALECAIKQGHTEAYHQLALGVMIFEKNPPKSLKLHVKAGNKGSLKSIVFLRSVFRDGSYGYEADKELATCFGQFIKEVAKYPQGIFGLKEACPLPDHPDLGDGDIEIDDKKRLEVVEIERKFNPKKQKIEAEKKEQQQQKEKAIKTKGNTNKSSKKGGTYSRF